MSVLFGEWWQNVGRLGLSGGAISVYKIGKLTCLVILNWYVYTLPKNIAAFHDNCSEQTLA